LKRFCACATFALRRVRVIENGPVFMDTRFADVRTLVERQYQGVKANHDRVRIYATPQLDDRADSGRPGICRGPAAVAIRLAASIASAPLINIFFGSQPRSAQVPSKDW
jgi:hypothetical protein